MLKLNAIMETFKRLNRIMDEISIISIDSQILGKKPQQMEKKLQNYIKGNLLIDEASQLIEKLENDVKKINITKIDRTQINDIDKYIDLLEISNPHFNEILYIIETLYANSVSLPTSMQITDNVDQEIIHEIEEVTV